MKSYHRVEDFLNDPDFKNWVLNGDQKQSVVWEKWIKKHPKQGKILSQAKIILLELNAPGGGWTEKRQNHLFTQIQKRIKSNKAKTEGLNYTSLHLPIEKRIRASLVFFLLMAAFVAFFSIDFSAITGIKETAVATNKVEWITKSNPSGQKSTIHLPDGSTLVLNSESAIRFRNNFGKDHRDVYLEGESFFEVAPDSLLPFRVFSGDLVTIALGTSFNINSYKKGHVQVQLATGKVMVFQDNKEDKPLFLIPGEEVNFTEGEEMSKRKFDHRTAFLWKEGTLWFDVTPLSEVIPALERWYGVQVEVKNWPQREKLISGEFTDTYLSDVLESLGYAYGFDYQINNKAVKVIFTKNEDI